MRLADFILSHREPILGEWEAFARTCAPASATMDITALRDHAGEMLTVIAEDLKTAQSDVEQAAKAKGLAADDEDDTAAEEHGAGRAGSGFTVAQMVAEYRALRASVIRLWTEFRGELVVADMDDVTRFHEAIDQALAESVTRYNQDLEQSKELFLAILGHDLRTPLGAIATSAAFMLDSGELSDTHRKLMEGIRRSTAGTIRMVGDLLDFTRSRLGEGIPVEREAIDMGSVVRHVVHEIAVANPGRAIDVEMPGEQHGEWDRGRIGQALSNLIANAVEHGEDGPVRVEVGGTNDEVTVAVHNPGTISSAHLDGIFNPMKPTERRAVARRAGPTGNLGLGLYIAERIVYSHGGRIDVASSEAEGTTFTAHLPRRAPTS